MRTENRTGQRVEFSKSIKATMVAIDGTWKRPVDVKDMSSVGAKVWLEGKVPVGKGGEFFLLLSSTGLIYRRCELAWINGDMLGVAFLAANNKKRARAS